MNPIARTARFVMLAAAGTVWLGVTTVRAEPPDLRPTYVAMPTMDAFLDRLMLAESGARDTARNPRSTALGPFQFIEQTFLEVAWRHFGDELRGRTSVDILALRTDRAFARRVAEAYTRDNAALLAANGIEASWTNLRLAFFAGPTAALRILRAPPRTPVDQILGPAAMRANPFLAGYSAERLIAWAARSLELRHGPLAEPTQVIIVAARKGASAPVGTLASAPPGSAKDATAGPPIVVRCKIARPSCKAWLALAEKRAMRARMAAVRR